MITTDTKKIIDVTIKMRLGKSTDFSKEISLISNTNDIITKTVPKYGQPYWLRSLANNKFDNRNYQINEDTDWTQFKDYLRREMVYVAAGYFELKEADEI